MTLNKFFPKIVKNILPFAPVVGVVSTCLLVASAVAQVAEPILNAGIGLQVSTYIYHLLQIVNVNTYLQYCPRCFLDPRSSTSPYWWFSWLLVTQTHWLRRNQISYYGY